MDEHKLLFLLIVYCVLGLTLAFSLAHRAKLKDKEIERLNREVKALKMALKLVNENKKKP